MGVIFVFLQAFSFLQIAITGIELKSEESAHPGITLEVIKANIRAQIVSSAIFYAVHIVA